MVLGPIGVWFFFFFFSWGILGACPELCAEISPCVTNTFPGMCGVEGGREPMACNLPLGGDMEA